MKSIRRESRICFGISYFATEAEANTYAEQVKREGRTYNGGYFDGMPCGRSPNNDYNDPEYGRLYAVTD